MENDAPQFPLSTEQWTAARLLVARLRSEAALEDFDFGELGVAWLDVDDVVVALSENGDVLKLGDMFYAAITLLWSVVIGFAEETRQHPLDIVSQLGLGLAQNDPT